MSASSTPTPQPPDELTDAIGSIVASVGIKFGLPPTQRLGQALATAVSEGYKLAVAEMMKQKAISEKPLPKIILPNGNEESIIH